MTRRLRPIVAPFVVARSAGARVRTRLPVSDHDEQVLRAVGELLGRLAGRIWRGGDQRDGWTRWVGPRRAGNASGR